MRAAQPIPATELPIVWDKIESLIRRATERDHGRTSPETVKADLEAETALLWVSPDLSAVAVTTTETHPTGLKSLVIRYAAGNGGDFNRKMVDFEEYARALGCDAIEIYGRRGWLRALDGFEEDMTVMRKSL